MAVEPASRDPVTQPRFMFFVNWKCKCHKYKEVIRDYDDGDSYASLEETQTAAYQFCKADHEAPRNECTHEVYYVSIWKEREQLVVRYQVEFVKLSTSDEEEEGEIISP